MVKRIETLEAIAWMIFKLLKSDRDAVMGVGGFTGEGKSAFMTLLQMAYAKVSGTYWSFNRMTWSRKELLTWIDGEKDSKIDKNKGLRKGQLAEYSAALADELFSMFYRRNWFDDDQIDAIATFNMCRDRHLFLGGNVPDFWDLDPAFTKRVRFYAYIPTRGVAWIFEQENNPFCKDNWNALENKKLFRKYRNPYKIPNFVCEVHYPDWTPEQKKEYYRIRNKKRLTAIDSNKSERKERYGVIKFQRDAMINMVFKLDEKLTNKDVAEVIGITPRAIALIRNGER